jgi:3-oxosteroid 1-dehydrogenase
MPSSETTYDVIVAGSGAAGLAAALTSAHEGLKVLVLEKSDRIGGTSAMSGAGTWVPANHHAAAAGIADSKAEALAYLRTVSPEGWRESEDHLWQAFVEAAPEMLAFIEAVTPLEFELIAEPDPMAEAEGGKGFGRMLSAKALSRNIVGEWAPRIRRSTLPHIFTYREGITHDFYGSPLRAGLALGPRLLKRWVTNTAGQGNALIVGLLKGCLDAGVTVKAETAVKELATDATGSVTGVVCSGPAGPQTIRAAKGVVLATGGFEWDADMRARHFPGEVDRLGSPNTNTGDGQRLAKSVGAMLERLDQANIYPTLPTIYDGKPHGMPITFQAAPHVIVVNGKGERFCSELDFNIGEALDRRDPATGKPLNLPAWMIADRRFLRSAWVFRYHARFKPGWIISADTISELARRIDIPASALQRTVARFNEFCRKGRDEDFRRGEGAWERYKSGADANTTGNPSLGPIQAGPFYAMSFNRSILGTKGGARTDASGRVLREDRSIVPGLYCAGNAMANPIGTRAVGPGTTIGPCMTWGYICGKSLARADNRF